MAALITMTNGGSEVRDATRGGMAVGDTFIERKVEQEGDESRLPDLGRWRETHDLSKANLTEVLLYSESDNIADAALAWAMWKSQQSELEREWGEPEPNT
jgi:hypothetical protein